MQDIEYSKILCIVDSCGNRMGAVFFTPPPPRFITPTLPHLGKMILFVKFLNVNELFSVLSKYVYFNSHILPKKNFGAHFFMYENICSIFNVNVPLLFNLKTKCSLNYTRCYFFLLTSRVSIDLTLFTFHIRYLLLVYR